MLQDLAKRGMFSYAGRTNQGGAKFTSGECAMLTESTGGQANVRRGAKFDWAVTQIPYWDDVKGAPQNAIIGGASLWVMGGKTNNAYKGVAQVLRVPVAARGADASGTRTPATCRSRTPPTT